MVQPWLDAIFVIRGIVPLEALWEEYDRYCWVKVSECNK